MIVKKTFEVNAKDIDSVALEVPNEIKAGWTIRAIIPLELVFSICDTRERPTFEIVLERK